MSTPHNLLEKLRASRTATEAPAILEETTAERVHTDAALHTLASIAAPADLQLRLRLALSHERVRADRRWTGRIAHHWHLLRENTLRGHAMHGVLALATLVLLAGIGLNLGTVAPSQTVEADDIPLIGFSSPRYLYSSSGLHQAIVSEDEAPILVEAKVNAGGRVYDYRVLSGALDATGIRALRERMLSAVFKPAQILGEPVRGHVILTFADVEVHG